DAHRAGVLFPFHVAFMIVHDNVHNTNIVEALVLPSPDQVKEKVPFTEEARDFVFRSRRTIQEILDRKDPRRLIVVGPCSIPDTRAAVEYAGRLRDLADGVKDVFFLVMRVYFEKPRTSVGWKGFINDPFLDDTFHIEDGLVFARQLLAGIAKLGVPVGTE